MTKQPDVGGREWWKTVIFSKFSAIMFFTAWPIAAGFVFVFWYWPSNQTELSTMALMGDFLGGWFASCVALASTVLFFGAILLQRDELAATRDQLKLSLAEMEMVRAVHEQQARELSTQTLIARHTEVVNQIITLARFRSDLTMASAGIVEGTHAASRQLATISMSFGASEPILEMLVNDRAITNEIERAYLMTLAGVGGQEVRRQG